MNQLKFITLFLCIQLFNLPQLEGQVAVNMDNSDPDPSAMLDITATDKGMLIPRLTSIQRTAIATPATGLLVFDTDTGSFWFKEASGWKELRGNTLDESYDQGGAGNGRTIEASDGAVRIDGEDGFIVTGNLTSGAEVEVTGAGSRMFFNPRRAAFRAGFVTGTEWDPGNIGFYSTAWGTYTTASGPHSTAWGSFTNASGAYSTAWGNTTASGAYSTAWGLGANARSYLETTLGRFDESYTPLSQTTWNDADRLFVVANGSNSTSRSNALTILKNGNIGIGEANPTQVLHLKGDSGIDGIQFPDGTLQTTAFTAGILNTLDAAYDQGGAGSGRTIEASDGAVRIDGEDGLIVTGTLGVGDDVEVSGSGTRLLFNPRKSAFRAGSALGDDWNSANIGDYSSALGRNNMASGTHSTSWGSNNIASGNGSTAFGFQSQASGGNSTAWGYTNTASGQNSTVWGYLNSASGTYSTGWGRFNSASGSFGTVWGEQSSAIGTYSTAFGYAVSARSYLETVIGRFDVEYTPSSETSWNSSDRLFVIANGSSTNRSNALTILKNGNIGIGEANPTHLLHVLDGNIGIDGAQAMAFGGTNSNIPDVSPDAQLVLDGSGNSGYNLSTKLLIRGFDNETDVKAVSIVDENSNEIFYVKSDATTDGAGYFKGKLGINRTSPTDRFHISAENGENAMRVQVGGATKLRVFSGGGVSIGYNPGGSGPSYALQLSNNPDIQIGSARATSWVTYSDERIKSKVRDLEYGLHTVLALRPKSYLLHNSERDKQGIALIKGDQFSKDIGFIAQEVNEIIPEIVFKPENEATDLWSMNYEKLTPVLVKAIQELYKENEALKKKNLELEDQQSHMELRLQMIEEALFEDSEN